MPKSISCIGNEDFEQNHPLNSKKLVFQWKPKTIQRELNVEYYIEKNLQIAQHNQDAMLQASIDYIHSLNQIYTHPIRCSSRALNDEQIVQENNYKILIVDDQTFNIDAMLIILQYNIGLDAKKYC